jgi:hypothetical protein
MSPANRATAAVAIALLTLLSSTAQAQEKKRIERAIEAGVQALKRQQVADGSWLYQQGTQHSTGATALAALTLLECDVPPDDPIIQRAASVIRSRAGGESNTYDIALVIMFLDRLGKAEDEGLINSLTASLVKGQNKSGGWSYNCPVGPGNAARQPGPGRGVVGRGAEPPLPPAPPLAGAGVPLVGGQQNLARGVGWAHGDNSNTQFATLALWVSRRHKLDGADQALEAVGQRFSSSQNPDGGWSYYPMGVQRSTATMTCAGLLGMAVSYGVAREAVLHTGNKKPDEGGRQTPTLRDPNRDPAVRLALLTLGQFLAGPYILAQKNPALGALQQPFPVVSSATDYYLLWSVERVAMAFGLRTINRVDWYAWGSRIAVATQNADGTWAGLYGPVIDTSFALLFLRRSNLVKDLSNDLKDLIRDPGEVRLKAGGVGGKGLQGQDTSLDPSAVGKADRKPKKPRPSSIPDLRPDDADPAAAQPAAVAPDNKLDPETAQLSAAVVRASGAEQEALIDQLRDAKGVVHTQALAAAIPQLSGAARTRARDALAERLTRMTAGTLRDKFRDEDLEIRRAAALAGAMKNEQSFVPDLIELLSDPEPPVARAAHAALKALTREDFGPSTDATRAERTEAIGKWKAWWASQKK